MFDRTDLDLRCRAQAANTERGRADRAPSPLEPIISARSPRRYLADLLLTLGTRLARDATVASTGSSQASVA